MRKENPGQGAHRRAGHRRVVQLQRVPAHEEEHAREALPLHARPRAGAGRCRRTWPTARGCRSSACSRSAAEAGVRAPDLPRPPRHHAARSARARPLRRASPATTSAIPPAQSHAYGWAAAQPRRGGARGGGGADRGDRRARSSSPPAPPRPTTSPSWASPEAWTGDGRHIVTTRPRASGGERAAGAPRGARLAGDAVPAGPTGVVAAADVARALTPDTALVSLIAVQNEIGTVQPLRRGRRALQGARRDPAHRRGPGGRQDPAGRRARRGRPARLLGAQALRAQGRRGAVRAPPRSAGDASRRRSSAAARSGGCAAAP